MSDRVNLSPEIAAICKKLGHRYDSVARLDIYPASVEAVVYDRNEEDQVFVGEDGRLARRVITTKIRT